VQQLRLQQVCSARHQLGVILIGGGGGAAALTLLSCSLGI
jgi:hypothetical protein